jgi:hypothetical protein
LNNLPNYKIQLEAGINAPPTSERFLTTVLFRLLYCLLDILFNTPATSMLIYQFDNGVNMVVITV